MQNNVLQHLIATNAERIRNLHIQIGYQQDQAKNFKEQGETAFKLASYAKIDRLRNKVVKAVAIQRTLKAEISFNHQLVRNAKKFAFLCAALGLVPVIKHDLTAQETSDEIDAIAALPTTSILDPED